MFFMISLQHHHGARCLWPAWKPLRRLTSRGPCTCVAAPNMQPFERLVWMDSVPLASVEATASEGMALVAALPPPGRRDNWALSPKVRLARLEGYRCLHIQAHQRLPRCPRRYAGGRQYLMGGKAPRSQAHQPPPPPPMGRWVLTRLEIHRVCGQSLISRQITPPPPICLVEGL